MNGKLKIGCSLMTIFLMLGVATGYTDEEVRWYLNANMPGVCSECPEVIAFYKERLEAMDKPQAFTPAIGAPKEYEETFVLNATHNLVIVHTLDSLGRPVVYNVTRWIQPPEPEVSVAIVIPTPAPAPTQLTLEQRVAALEARLAKLCNSGVTEAC